jgi:membrane protein implicated in regulation of membrane protease activity
VLALAFAGAGVALLVGQAMGSAALGLLVVAGIYLLIALVLILVGRRRLRRLRHFLAETRADLKRDVEWLRSLQ